MNGVTSSQVSGVVYRRQVSGVVYRLGHNGPLKRRYTWVGHHCLCEFGDSGNDTSFEKQFNLSHHTLEDYRNTHFYKQDRVIVIKQGLNRVEEDVSWPWLTFQEWAPDVYTSRSPVTMIINSSELRVAGFKFKEVSPPEGTRSLEGMVLKRFVLSVDDDTKFRSRCEWIIPLFTPEYTYPSGPHWFFQVVIKTHSFIQYFSKNFVGKKKSSRGVSGDIP